MPSSKEIADDVEARIVGKQWTSGDRLPSLRELADHYGVSPRTVYSALERCKERGLVRSEQGKGYFVI